MVEKSQKRPLFDLPIVKRAVIDAFKKLDPRIQVRNPVMFVVEVGSVLTTLLIVRDLIRGEHGHLLFTVQVTLWLWFTVVFANFAEAMAEGRGKAQADTLRKAKTETIAHRIIGAVNGNIGTIKTEAVPAPLLRKGDMVLVKAGEFIPAMAIAGRLATKKSVPVSAGTFPVDTTLFVGLLVGVILILVALTFFPVLSLGPIVEHFLMKAGIWF